MKFFSDLEVILVGAVLILDLGLDLEAIRARVAQLDPHVPDLTHQMDRNPDPGT